MNIFVLKNTFIKIYIYHLSKLCFKDCVAVLNVIFFLYRGSRGSPYGKRKRSRYRCNSRCCRISIAGRQGCHRWGMKFQSLFELKKRTYSNEVELKKKAFHLFSLLAQPTFFPSPSFFSRKAQSAQSLCRPIPPISSLTLTAKWAPPVGTSSYLQPVPLPLADAAGRLPPHARTPPLPSLGAPFNA